MSELNILTAQNVSIKFHPASVGDRILAAILDGVFQFIYLLVIYAFLFFTILTKNEGENSESLWFIYVFVILLLPLFFYNLLSEYFFNGQTLGKRIIKLRVIKLDGTEPGIGEYLLRWILRIVDIQMFSGLVAVIAIIASDRSQRLGDMAAGTTVIKEQDFVPLAYLRPVSVNENHTVSFPEVERLSNKDIQTLKVVLQTWQQTDNYDVVEQAVAKVRKHLDITNSKGLSDIDFIKTILADHSHLSHF